MSTRAPKLGLVIGSLGTLAAFSAVHIDRLTVQPHGIDAAAQAAAQSTRLNIYGSIMIAAALIAVFSGIILLLKNRSK